MERRLGRGLVRVMAVAGVRISRSYVRLGSRPPFPDPVDARLLMALVPPLKIELSTSKATKEPPRIHTGTKIDAIACLHCALYPALHIGEPISMCAYLITASDSADSEKRASVPAATIRVIHLARQSHRSMVG